MRLVLSWITLYPDWYVSERNAIARRYPDFRVDERGLKKGVLCYYGELVVRPPGGAVRHAICLTYPGGSPFEVPIVAPLEMLPEFDDDGAVKDVPKAKLFDRRHQMPRGALCLFQRETRGAEGGEWISGVDAVRRAEQWFLGHHTGHWPPDSRESELEPHFYYAGDVLLSNTFYRDEINGHGRFFMVRDVRRILDRVGDENPPLIVTVITKTSGVIEEVIDSREELENIYPWLGNDAWSPEKLVEFEKKRKDDNVLGLSTDHGHWWSLPCEPPPFHNGAGLLKVLADVAPDGDAWKMVSDAFGGELTHANHFFGLRYPGRGGEDEWLVLAMPRQSKEIAGGVLIGGNQEKRRTFEQGQILCYRSHSARPQDLHLRNTSVVSPGIRRKVVGLIGLGALGSRVAELLGQAGVETFLLCDSDRLTTGNVARHIGGLKDFGSKKTQVVAQRLFELNPSIKLAGVWEDSAVSSLEQLAKFLRAADVVISTTADENAESMINQIAVLEKKPVVYGRAMRRGTMGRVFLVRPGEDACKACLGALATESRSGDAGENDWPEVVESEEDILLHECGRPVIPASAVDLSFVASLTARMALDFLEEKPLEANHWLWSTEGAPDVDPELEKPMSGTRRRFERRDDCPVCQEPDVRGLLLQDEARRAIVAEVESSADTETGGILLGHIDDGGQAIVLRASGPGPKAKKSPGGFERDIEFVQSELDRAAAELGQQGLYIGEWHSHLEKEPEPSAIDVGSMSAIASSSNYATRCPVLLIAGLDPDSGKVVGLRTWSFQAFGRMHRIDCSEADNENPPSE